ETVISTAGIEVRPQWLEEVTLRVERHPANHVPQSRTEEDGQQGTAEKEHAIPEQGPDSVGELRAQFDGDASSHEQPEHDDEWQVKTAETGGVQGREGEKQRPACRDQPDFVAVPHRPNSAKIEAPLGVSSSHEQVNNPGPQVEA